GQVAHRRDLETIGQLAEVMEVHDLSDQATPDDPYPQPAGHIHPGSNPPSSPAGPGVGGWSSIPVGTFHRPYTKAWAVSTPAALSGLGEHLGGFLDALLRVDER